MNEALAKYIATRDRKVRLYESSAPLAEAFDLLLTKGTVRKGGRTSCGGAVDPSWKEFTAWNEVVRKAQALGYDIEVTSIKHGNGWATKAGGFWDENDYRLISPLTRSTEQSSAVAA